MALNSPPAAHTGTTEAVDPLEALELSLDTLQAVESAVRASYARVLSVGPRPSDVREIDDPQHAARVGVENLGLDLADLLTKISTVRIHTELRVSRAGGRALAP